MIIKVIGICIICAIASLLLKEAGKGEISLLIGLSCTVYILYLTFGWLEDILNEISSFAKDTGIEEGIFLTVMKITGIAYITQSASALCYDAGEGALAGKIELGGKIMICASAVPAIKALFVVIAGIL